jgi:hypothetical protein
MGAWKYSDIHLHLGLKNLEERVISQAHRNYSAQKVKATLLITLVLVSLHRNILDHYTGRGNIYVQQGISAAEINVSYFIHQTVGITNPTL